MTTNTTQLAIDTTEFVLAWWRRGGPPADMKAAGEYAEIKRKLNKLWLGFLVGTLAGAVAYLRFDLWCLPLAIAIVGALSVWATTFSGESVPPGLTYHAPARSHLYADEVRYKPGQRLRFLL